MTKHVVVVGAGQAALSLVAKLRALDFDGRVTLVGNESVPPYQRPPLSKKYLTGEMALDRLFLRPAEFYAQNDIDLRTGVTATGIDPAGNTITLGDQTLPYDKLVLATGSRPRLLPASIGGDLGGVFAVRTLADVDAMAAKFVSGARVLIVGGGYIGLEAAAVAATRGLDVTLIEMAPRILQRVAAPQTADYFRALHQSHGVRILEDTGLERLIGERDVASAVLGDGSQIDVDFVIVGIGILPNTEIAADAGLGVENGIAVDEFCQTSDKNIFAIGDCASFLLGDTRMRLESVGNAIDMGEAAAATIAGQPTPYVAKPWFWSDQYDVTLQIAGLNVGFTDVVARQDGDRSSFWYFDRDKLLAVDAMGDARSYMLGKRWIEAGKSPAKTDIADPSVALKTVDLI